MCYKENFSKRLIYLRDKKGITQQELADNLNITRQSLSLYEKAERTINIELLAKIADFFNVSTDYLLGLSDVKSQNNDIKKACKITNLNVHHPEHYQGERECIDIMLDLFGIEAVTGFCKCNIFKYRFRADKKNGEEDILKAQWYENKLSELLNMKKELQHKNEQVQ